MAASGPLGAEKIYTEVSRQLGVDFEHRDGRSGRKHYVETTASGGGWLDFDDDGDQDLYLINGAITPGSWLETAPRNALYENRAGKFVDVAPRAGVADTEFGMGMCVGDVDGDGGLDFVVTNYGPDRLYRNLGNGRFEEIGEPAGMAESQWSSSCALGDLDGDGDLDLFVTHYLDFGWQKSPVCGSADRPIYCHPSAFAGVTDSLFINRGPGKGKAVVFEEVGGLRGIAQGASEKGLGVVLSDLDEDGDLDIFVANDGSLNRLYVNDGAGRFEDQGLLSGVGLSAVGAPEASMGVDVGDADGDGRLDLIVTHFSMETNTFYRGLGDLQFDDTTAHTGLGPPSFRHVGWGVQFLDYDLDGQLDLAVANGHMQEGVEELEPGLRYRQPNLLLRNRGGGQFEPVQGVWQGDAVSRSLAVADWNDDGRPDLLVTNTNGRVDLLQNSLQGGHSWLGLSLRGPAANRFAIGARVELEAAGQRQVREVRSGGGFQSQSDLRLLFGLGDYRGKVKVEIRWPDGRRQSLTTEELDRYWTVSYP